MGFTAWRTSLDAVTTHPPRRVSPHPGSAGLPPEGQTTLLTMQAVLLCAADQVIGWCVVSCPPWGGPAGWPAEAGSRCESRPQRTT